MKLTLLGTGSPLLDPDRRGPAQVIEEGGGLVLIDCGSGVAHRLAEAGYAPRGNGLVRPPIRRIALTHLHSDHVMGLPDLLWTGWVLRWWDEPPPIAGPPGTAALVQGLLDAFAYDIRVRLAGDQYRRNGPASRVDEVEEGWTVDGDGWRLRAFRVDHAPVDQAFGYRMEAGGGAIVVSGDTRPSDNLVRHAWGADLLVHEVYWRRGALRLRERLSDPDELFRRTTIENYHTSSEEVGEVAARTEVKHLVLSHLILRGGSPADLLADVAPDFARPITVGSDLQTFVV
jgi:ribonuclease Z